MTKLTVAFRNFANAPKNAMAGMPFVNSIAAPHPYEWSVLSSKKSCKINCYYTT